jgi:hypothetical protein
VRDGDLLAVDGFTGPLLVKVAPTPREPRPLLLVATLAMLAAVAMLVYLAYGA